MESLSSFWTWDRNLPDLVYICSLEPSKILMTESPSQMTIRSTGVGLSSVLLRFTVRAIGPSLYPTIIYEKRVQGIALSPCYEVFARRYCDLYFFEHIVQPLAICSRLRVRRSYFVGCYDFFLLAKLGPCCTGRHVPALKPEQARYSPLWASVMKITLLTKSR